MPKQSRANKEFWDKKKRSRPQEATPGRQEKLTQTQGGLRLANPPGPEKQGQVYLMEAADGTLVHVPEERLDSWMNRQDAIRNEEESKDNGQLIDAVMALLYGKEEKPSS